MDLISQTGLGWETGYRDERLIMSGRSSNLLFVF